MACGRQWLVLWTTLLLTQQMAVYGADAVPGASLGAMTSRLNKLDFCQASSWATACKDHPRRRDIFCGDRFKVLRQTLLDYCVKHQKALADIKAGTAKATDYKYVMSTYRPGNGLGNRIPGMVSGFYLALMTDRLFIHDYQDYKNYFDSPIDFGYNAFWGQEDPRGMGQPTMYPGGFMHENYTMTNVMIAGNLNELFGQYLVWNIDGHADYHAAPFSANKHFQERMRTVFPTYELFWPLSLFIFRYNDRLHPMVEDFQKVTDWGNMAVIGVQIRTRKMGDNPEVFHRFGDLTRSLIAEARGQSKPIAVFLSADSQKAYTEMRDRLKDVPDVRIISTEHEQLVDIAQTVGANPGTEDSALLDLALLSHSTVIMISGSSSFGGCAAGLGGLHPYYISQIDTGNPSFHMGATANFPSYWKTTSSEPCQYQGWWNDNYLDPEAMALWRAHPLHNQWRQCHGPHGGPETDEQKKIQQAQHLRRRMTLMDYTV